MLECIRFSSVIFLNHQCRIVFNQEGKLTIRLLTLDKIPDFATLG